MGESGPKFFAEFKNEEKRYPIRYVIKRGWSAPQFGTAELTFVAVSLLCPSFAFGHSASLMCMVTAPKFIDVKLRTFDRAGRGMMCQGLTF